MSGREYKVSIIVPAHNAAGTINRCIDGILGQTYNNFEIIVVDNDSSDNLDKIIDAYNDDRIKYIKTRKKGVSNARNIGIRKSSGEFVSFCDADDKYAPEFLEKMVSNCLANDVHIAKCAVCKVFSKSEIVTEGLHELSGQIIDPKIPENSELLRNLFFRSNKTQIQCTTPSLLIKKNILSRNRVVFDSDVCMMEDVLFYADLFNLNERISFIDEPLYLYYQNPNSATHSEHNYIAIISGAIMSCSKLHEKNGEDPKTDMKYLQVIFHYMYCDYFVNGNIYVSDHLSKIARNAKMSKDRCLWVIIARIIEKKQIVLLKVLFHFRYEKTKFKKIKALGGKYND